MNDEVGIQTTLYRGIPLGRTYVDDCYWWILNMPLVGFPFLLFKGLIDAIDLIAIPLTDHLP